MPGKKKEKLPKGMGQIPSWWLDDVDHDTIEAEKQRKAEAARIEEERKEKQQAKISPRAKVTTNGGGDNYGSGGGTDADADADADAGAADMAKDMDRKEKSNWNELGIATGEPIRANGELLTSPYAEDGHMQSDSDPNLSSAGMDESSGGRSLNITITSEEEAALVELRRKKSHVGEGFGQEKLKSRPGGVEITQSPAQQQQHRMVKTSLKTKPFEGGDSAAASIASRGYAGAGAAGPTHADKDTTKSSSSVKSSPFREKETTEKAREFKTHFTGVSPFDFAMQQRAKEKERREKERIAREALSRHHGHSVEVDKATEMKRKDEEERKKKKEAQENLKLFKGVFKK